MTITTSTLGFVAGRPPKWDVERFLHGDEVETALITLEPDLAQDHWIVRWSPVVVGVLVVRTVKVAH